MLEEVPEIILDKLRCYQCNLYLSVSPIYISITEEQICGRCVRFYEQEKVELPLAARNDAYELVIGLFKFPCRYANDGCTEKLPMKLMREHEEDCPYY